MFGYIRVNRAELKIKDFETYHAYYCGLCLELRRKFGRAAQLSLSYDMTFLTVLLTALYEASGKAGERRCVLHPAQKQQVIINEFTSYAADMSILLSYFNLDDNWRDDHDLKSRALSLIYLSDVKRLASIYPRQFRAVRYYIEKLRDIEKHSESDLDEIAGLTGDMLAEIFVYKEDIWSPTLRRMAFFLGKYIYLADAFDDRDDDKKKNAFNPWLIQPRQYSEDEMLSILNMTMGECALAFELLPVISYLPILRNIIYSGVWTAYSAKKKETDDV